MRVDPADPLADTETQVDWERVPRRIQVVQPQRRGKSIMGEALQDAMNRTLDPSIPTGERPTGAATAARLAADGLLDPPPRPHRRP